MNSIIAIYPYKHNGLWVFDDPAEGLDKEPFIAGADTVIDAAVENIQDADNGFVLLFSAHAFPGHEYRFDRGDPEAGGYWYHSPALGITGWLCPALFAYFETAPPSIYAQFRPNNG